MDLRTRLKLMFLTTLLVFATTASAQVKELCDTSTDCQTGRDLIVGDDLDTGGDVVMHSPRGGLMTLKYVEAALTALSGATATATALIPAGSTVYGCTAKVTTLITGATSFDMGETDTDRWCNDVAVAAGTACTPANATVGVPFWVAAATNVVLTANGSNFTAGAVRISCLVGNMTAASN